MANRLPPLNSLKAFEVSARLLSFTKAAQELHVTQAAVSHQIKSLESHLGLKLFMRKNRALLLTEEGQSYFLDIKDIFTSLHEATDKLLARGAKGALTVMIQPSLAIQWLVPRLNAFNQLNPDIDVRIKADNIQQDYLEDDVDIAFFYGQGGWHGLTADKIKSEYLMAVCSPMLLNGDKPLADPSDLQYHTLLHDTSRQDWKRWFKKVKSSVGNVEQGPIFSHSSMVLQAALHGHGVALVSNVLATPDIESGRLVAPFTEVLDNQDAYYLVCRENQAGMARIAPFRQWVLDTMRSEGEEVIPEHS
ncbi:transcriptional regulator GcvA [Thalassotalea aquiviva]|uniref:transcriptional regulator GcvA n=1 Tax=Thalassotalea aquiviva TaxID=3242415 RepID=UPI00352B1922